MPPDEIPGSPSPEPIYPPATTGEAAGAAPAVGGEAASPQPVPVAAPEATPTDAGSAALSTTEVPGAPAEPAAGEPAKPPSILGAALAEQQAAEAAKPAETAPEAEAAPAEYAFTFPEGFEAREPQLAPFKEFLTANKLTQEQGQQLVDLYVANMQELQQATETRQRQAFDAYREQLRDEFEKSDLAGNRRQTTINEVMAFLRHFAQDDAHFTSLMQKGEIMGWVDDPAMIRLFANAARGLASLHREPSAPIVPLRPAAQPNQRGQGTRRADRRYGTMTGAA